MTAMEWVYLGFATVAFLGWGITIIAYGRLLDQYWRKLPAEIHRMAEARRRWVDQEEKAGKPES